VLFILEVNLLVTAQEIFNTAMDLMDKRNNVGKIDATKTARYLARTPALLTVGQNILTRDGNVYNFYEFNHKKYKNLLGERLKIVDEHISTDKVYTTDKVAHSYYFDIDSDSTVTIEELDGTWNQLLIFNNVGIIKTTAYSGTLVSSPTATQTRITFGGNTYYQILKVALFAEPFLPFQVPVYREWIEYIMPDDFESINQIVTSSPIQAYQKDSMFKFQGTNRLFVSWEFEGTEKVVYTPVSIPITLMTQILQMDDTTCLTTLTYYLAAHLVLLEDAASASFFNQMYEEGKAQANKRQPSPIEPIEDVCEGWE
jgi:hypothetical protein